MDSDTKNGQTNEDEALLFSSVWTSISDRWGLDKVAVVVGR